MKQPRRKAAIGFEPRDLTPREIGLSAAALFGGIGLSIALVAALFAIVGHPQRPGMAALETSPQTPPWPRLEVDGKSDGDTVIAAAEQKLKGYAWVDRSAGTVRIPIERAMQLLVQQGWPDAKGSGTP
jgi:hypothetical protein